ncbi:MAG: pitrilysin family protein [Paracoccaceae bacterium]
MTIQMHTLSNGFRIVTENMPSMKSATLGIWVDAGARHERLDQNGIAHFLEHMAFKGTKRRSSLDIAEAIENVGGFINAYTSRETTAYYARVLEEHVPLALDVISDILLEPAFDPRELEVERGVILSEIGQSFDTPDDIIFDWLQETAFPDQPMGRPILGPAERVKSFTRENLANFVQEYYGPEQMILAAAGAVDHDTIVREAEKLFSHLPRRSASTAPKANFVGGEKREIKDLEQAHFTFAIEAPGFRDDDVYTGQIFSTAFGGGMSSRLFQEAREKRGLCYSIFASASAHEDTGMFTVYAGTSGEKVGELAELTVSEMRRATEDMSDVEVERARQQMKAGMLMGLESPSARCERLARMVSVWNRVPDLEETIAKIEAVTTRKVQDFAKKLCLTGKPAMALYGPVADAPELAILSDKLVA